MEPQQDPPWFDILFDSIYQFNALLDQNGKVLKANQAILNTTGLTQSDILGIPLWEVPWSTLSRHIRKVFRQAVREAEKGNFVRREFEILRSGRPKLVIDFSFLPVRDSSQQLKFIMVEGQDISSNTRTSEALFQSQARFQTIFEESGIGIVIKSVDGKMLDANPAFQALLGYSVEELKQLSYQDVTHPQDKASSRVLFDELISGKHKNYTIEKRYLHKDGQTIWGNITSSLVYGQDGQPLFVIGMVENITTQKQIETELGEMRHRLMYGRERERLRIAQDLHDGPLQEVIGISYQMQALENSLPGETDVEQFQSLQSALHQLAKSLRMICGELRPPTLIPFGLEKTILSHIDGIKTTHPELEVHLDLAIDGHTLPEQQRIVLFRIYQEAFRNILRHAKATTVQVRFRLGEGQAILEVQDNGLGFEPPRRWIEFARQGHLGLVGAMERAREAGGSLDISSSAGRGTLIRAAVPVLEENTQAQTTNGGG
jgi:PAS domain S-box-containing protein